MNGPGESKVLITGGAGFIGTNLAAHLADRGRRVIVYDNLSRRGVERNLAWLQDRFGQRVIVNIEDIRNYEALRRAVSQAGEVYHLAGQVAVTTSLQAPREDFEINARGTLNVLEALRELADPRPLVFTSTNKVYGRLETIDLLEGEKRYMPADPLARTSGISESHHLDLYSPYGCSKGTADQYVLDYARIYGLQTAVLRMSCIYGPHQYGTEDQGWLAHFLLCGLKGEPVTIYGSGKQVRDGLYVDDLVEALLEARGAIHDIKGTPFNLGGGPACSLSLLELLELMEDLDCPSPSVIHRPVRPGDQPYFVADTSRFRRATGWSPRVGIREGVRRLRDWFRKQPDIIPETAAEAVL
jgi:CDP-paratose 2-epimerase